MSYPTFLIGIGFLLIYFSKIRNTGAEVFGDKIWWNNLRPIHAFNYLIFAYLAFTQNKNSYVPLTIDVIFGTVAFLLYHYNSNNYRLLR